MDAPGATEASKSVSRENLEQAAPARLRPQHRRPNRHVHVETDDGDNDRDDEEGECVAGSGSESDYGGNDDEDDEPHLKYAYLTKQLEGIYRNGDATSAFLATGDKMIVGTHNGNIHVFSILLFRALRVYHAHSATVTSISTSPISPPLPDMKHGLSTRFAEEPAPAPSSGTGSIRGQSKPPPQTALPATPSNSIYVATSSIDGNVCVSSLVDQKDVVLRNFGRPVQAVAVSPEYKNDRTFVSGGRAGELILTIGGRVGVSTNSTTMGGAASTASSWLGTFGLGGNTGKDTVLHSGEGSISTIKWSLSGKYVAWVNEEGIKIMRSHLHLDSTDSELAWKRVSHTDRPNRPGWEEMASVWRARAEWVDESLLESELPIEQGGESYDEPTTPAQSTLVKERLEKLVVGWGGTVWVINVYPDRPNKSNKDQKIGTVEVATILRTDCIISGISLYTPRLLAVLAYLEIDRDPAGETDHSGSRMGARRRSRGEEPELRIIDIESKEEVSADTLSVSRFENLTAPDYHMCILPPWKTDEPVSQRGALGAFGTGLWDATMYPARFLSSAASIRSTTSSGDKTSSRAPSTFASRQLGPEEHSSAEAQEVAQSTGPKIFVHSPYDCVVALKRDLTDHLAWLNAHEKYNEAWTLLTEHPEAAGPINEASDNTSIVPGRSQTSLTDLFGDDRSSVTATDRGVVTAAEQEKRRIGELWIEQLARDNKWREAADVCVKTLASTPRWEQWTWAFIENDRLDEISSVVPIDIRPPLSPEVYEAILKYYLTRDRQRFSVLIDTWPFDLFSVDNMTSAIEEQLESEQKILGTEDGRILTRCLARLYLAGGHYSDALRCYIKLQDADTAMALINDHRLLDALSDDIPAFIMIRVSKEQMKSAPIPELADITAEPIKLLVSEAHTGIVPPATVIQQLEAADRPLFVYFYLRALWRGESLPHNSGKPRRGRHGRDAATKLAADEGKNLVDQFADTAVDLFARYDRPLLMEFLQTSTAYTFDAAVAICERHRFTLELIYLSSKMGQAKKALNLILSDLKDVSQAIAFAKSQDDPDLWEDLVDYSMDKPSFIHGLLVEAGTSIDPIKLVRRIPSGLEIEGLREGLTRLLREHDLQASISQGAAKILQSEVAIGMNSLRGGQRRGIKFSIIEGSSKNEDVETVPEQRDDEMGNEDDTEKHPTLRINSATLHAGICAGCQHPFHANEREILVAFACGHAFHLSHARPSGPSSPGHTPGGESGAETPRPFPPSRTLTLDEYSSSTSRTVGAKVTTARLLRDRIGQGCRICALAKELEAIGEAGG
ncbi:CLH domain-containing protein [Aspergillus lucknowensis]|uniref:Vps41 beta-propeller domain-containing protein n=1 Tax=Aspergillus lucknowensis TaxID=176173 RepID=A0ABR4LRC0_9EURO